jgi:hypothetical protein
MGAIDVKTSYQDHEPIVVKVAPDAMPEGAVLRKAKFKCPGATVVKVDENTFHLWAAPGKYTVEATGTWRLYQQIIDKNDKEWQVISDEDDYEFAASFEVTGGAAPDPLPFPPGPKPPSPQPGGPYQLLLLYDAGQLDNLPPSQRFLLTSLVATKKLEALGHRVLGVFAVQEPPTGSKYKAYFDAAKGDALPRIAIARLSGGKVTDFTLPETYEELAKLLDTEVLP